MKHGRQRWILISLAFVLFCSCSKLEAQELDWGQVDFSREVVESAVARGVSVSEVDGLKGQVTFKLSDGETFKINDAYVPIVRIGLDGYWYVNGERSDRKWEECEGKDVAAGTESVVEGYTDWSFNFEDGEVSLLKSFYSFDYDSVMRSVNHRGFSATAPENTLPAYRLSRLEEYGLKGKAKYISFNASLLEYALTNDPDACVGFLTGRVDEGALEKAEALRKLAADATKVFVSSSDYSDEAASLCKDAGFPLEVWTIDSANIILELPPYISGVTSNKLHAGRVIQGKM